MLLIGPPRSGKTTRILKGLEGAIRNHRAAEVLLLVPTASMKHHLLSTLARRGLMVPAGVVATMSDLVRRTTPDLDEASGAVADRLLDRVVAPSGLSGENRRTSSPALRRRIGSVIGEVWAAGSSGFELDSAVRTPQQRTFVDLFEKYEDALGREDLVHHNQRIALAAARIRIEGLGPVKTVYIDGFDRFTRQQDELVGALAEQAEEILVAMPDGLPRYPLQDGDVELLPSRIGPEPQVEMRQAASPRGEVLEIARQILESGRPLRDHGVILRSTERYSDLVREVFEALEIPFRLWDTRDLADHGVARHFVAWLRVIEQQFPGRQALEAIRSPLTPAGTVAEVDVFDFEVRRRLPGSGLDFLTGAAAKRGGPRRFLERLRPVGGFHRKRFGSKRWARECLNLLRALQQLPTPTSPLVPYRRTRDWRESLSARKALRRAIEDTARLPDLRAPRRISLRMFADGLEDVLRFVPLRSPGEPQEVVHVLSVLESRQWSLPVTFVCGLYEGSLPRNHAEDYLFDDADRLLLAKRGIELRTTADRSAEEAYLFRVATSRASERLVLTFPAHDSDGKPVVPSPLLPDLAAAKPCPWATPSDRHPPAMPVSMRNLPSGSRAEVAGRNEHFSPTGIDSYLQCPYQYFGGRTLDLRGPPDPPEQRLNLAVLGRIVHQTLERWHRDGGLIGEILDEEFSAKLKELHLPRNFRTDQARRALRGDLERFADDGGTSVGVPEGCESSFESKHKYRIEELATRPEVHCRIDRFDVDDRLQCFVTDFKYTRDAGVNQQLKQHQKGERLQLMLYLAALMQESGYKPGGMGLVALKGKTSPTGLSVGGAGGLRSVPVEELHRLLDEARAKTAQAVGSILDGSIDVSPRDKSHCDRYCRFAGVCRVKWQSAREADGLDGGSSG